MGKLVEDIKRDGLKLTLQRRQIAYSLAWQLTCEDYREQDMVVIAGGILTLTGIAATFTFMQEPASLDATAIAALGTMVVSKITTDVGKEWVKRIKKDIGGK